MLVAMINIGMDSQTLYIEDQKEINNILVSLDKKQGIYLYSKNEKTYIPYESIAEVLVGINTTSL